MTERLRGVPLSFEGFYRADFLGDNQWNIPGPEKTSGMPPYCLRWEYSKGSKRGGGDHQATGEAPSANSKETQKDGLCPGF